MAIVKQTEKKVKYRQQIMHKNNINIKMLFFFVILSDKHRLLGLCIKYICLMKDV